MITLKIILILTKYLIFCLKNFPYSKSLLLSSTKDKIKKPLFNIT